MLTSDFGHFLCKKPLRNGKMPDFVVIWSYNIYRDNWKYSLRGEKDGINLAKIAEKFGGGGHPSSAGFDSRLSPRELFKL